MRFHTNALVGLITFFGAVAVTGLSLVQAQMPTVEEALELSRKSGAPIFAMAGRET